MGGTGVSVGIARLRSELDSPSYSSRIDAWQQLLDTPSSEGSEASEPIAKTAAARIWKRYKRMRKKGAAALASLSEHDLHPLRIQGKKLRYLLELFPGVFPGEEVDQAVDLLKDLQDNLGDINDLKVHEEFFQAAGASRKKSFHRNRPPNRGGAAIGEA